jgi:phosphatidylglycerol:prolipoprotein diacylglycerol transferase
LCPSIGRLTGQDQLHENTLVKKAKRVKSYSFLTWLEAHANFLAMTYVHNLSPFALQFTETFGIRWYGLAYLAGFIIGYYMIVKLTRRGGTLFKEDSVADFVTYVAIGVLVGGRLGYCIFYAPELFSAFDGSFPYWGVLKVNEGGMASHGGILGVMVVCILYARAQKISVLHTMDLVTFGGSIGFFFGRIANFINGELYGREAPASLAWAVKFPQEMLLWLQKDFGKLGSLAPAVDALHEFKADNGEVVQTSASLWQQWLQSYTQDFSARQHVHETLEALIKATQHGNQTVTAALGAVLTPRYPSQLYQSVLEGLLVFLLLNWIWWRPQKPGVVTGWFTTLYCTARIIGEQFRMPDVQIGFQLFGLTRGQWLSIGMWLVGVTWLFICYRRKIQPMGGWNPGKTAKIKKA